MRAAGPIAATFIAVACCAAAAAAPAPHAPPGAACTPVVNAAPEKLPFPNPERPFAPAKLKTLVAATEQHFLAAARALCTAGTLTPRDLGQFRRLMLRDADGTAEPMLATRHAGPGAAYLDYAYDGGAPPPTVAQLRTALRCWKRPNGRGCDFGD